MQAQAVLKLTSVSIEYYNYDFKTDLSRLLEKPHKIDNQVITVVRQPPKKKLPLDPVRIHVQGISETTTKDCLRFYLEKFTDVEVQEVYLGCKNNALATFESEPGNYKVKVYTMRQPD